MQPLVSSWMQLRTRDPLLPFFLFDASPVFLRGLERAFRWQVSLRVLLFNGNALLFIWLFFLLARQRVVSRGLGFVLPAVMRKPLFSFGLLCFIGGSLVRFFYLLLLYNNGIRFFFGFTLVLSSGCFAVSLFSLIVFYFYWISFKSDALSLIYT